jgi:2-isopropylmalate synthase
VISNPLCYEIMTPESVGVPTNNLVLGKHSGRHALALRYEDMGYSMQPDEVDTVYARFTKLADRKKRIYDQDLIALLQIGQIGSRGSESVAADGPTAANTWAHASAAI